MPTHTATTTVGAGNAVPAPTAPLVLKPPRPLTKVAVPADAGEFERAAIEAAWRFAARAHVHQLRCVEARAARAHARVAAVERAKRERHAARDARRKERGTRSRGARSATPDGAGGEGSGAPAADDTCDASADGAAPNQLVDRTDGASAESLMVVADDTAATDAALVLTAVSAAAGDDDDALGGVRDEDDAHDLPFNLPSILADEKFVSKMRTGNARKALQRFELLSKACAMRAAMPRRGNWHAMRTALLRTPYLTS